MTVLRRRLVMLALLALAVGGATVVYAALGLPGRGFVRGHLGDVAATMLVYAVLGIVWLRVRPTWRAALTLAIATAIELGQLGWTATGTGELLLGNVFDPWDLLAYVVGVLIGLMWESRARTIAA